MTAMEISSKNYMMKFFQSAFSVVVQIALCKLGVGMMMKAVTIPAEDRPFTHAIQS